MPNDEPTIAGYPVSHWEQFFCIWGEFEGRNAIRGFLVNIAFSGDTHPMRGWEVTTRRIPPAPHEAMDYVALSCPASLDAPEMAEGGDTPDTGLQRAGGDTSEHYGPVTGTFGIHPASKWGW